HDTEVRGERASPFESLEDVIVPLEQLQMDGLLEILRVLHGQAARACGLPDDPCQDRQLFGRWCRGFSWHGSCCPCAAPLKRRRPRNRTPRHGFVSFWRVSRGAPG